MPTRYSTVAIWLHWIIAALVIANIGIAELTEDASKAVRGEWMGYHKAIGITILLLSVAFIVWRMGHPKPPFAPAMQRWERILARTVHTLFFVLILALPLAGWAMSSAGSGGAPVSWFGLFDIPGLPFEKNRDLAGVFHESHEIMGKTMLALVVLHIAGALKHMVIDRDGSMRKILPW